MVERDWYIVKSYSQDGRVFIEIRTPGSTLADALRIACATADNAARGSLPNGPAILVETRRV